MASILRLVVALELDGQPVSGFPITRRLQVDEVAGFAVEKDGTGDATFSALPTSLLDAINFLVLQTDKAVTLRLDAQSDAGIMMNAGGLVLILDAQIDAGAATNATVNNPAIAGTIAALRGLAGGT